VELIMQLVNLVRDHWSRIAEIGGAIGWVFGAVEWCRRRQAESRAKGPYLVPASFTAHQMADPVAFVDMRRFGEKLDDFSRRVGSHNLEMRLGFENRGPRVNGAFIVQPSPYSLAKTDGQIIEGPSPGWISYVYEDSRKGQVDHFKLRFETLDGFKRTHIYEIVHGKGSLTRIKPA
jgi:hypothetical protein